MQGLVDRAVYIDGESEASIVLQPALMAGVGFNDQTAPWGNKWIGKGAQGAAWYSNLSAQQWHSLPLPPVRPPLTTAHICLHCFQPSAVPALHPITGQLTHPVDSGLSVRLWVIFRGTENLQTNLGGFVLPPDSRLIQSVIEPQMYRPLEWITLLDIAPPLSGMLFAHTLSASSSNLAFLEGCYHAYTPYDAPFPGITVSTGTEDYFDSAYYFDGGEFRQENAGLTHFFNRDDPNDGLTEVSAYRIHEQDSIFFTDGFRFKWQVGDTNDMAGHKCTTEKGGEPGSTNATFVTAYTWAYVWTEESEERSEQQRKHDSNDEDGKLKWIVDSQ